MGHLNRLQCRRNVPENVVHDITSCCAMCSPHCQCKYKKRVEPQAEWGTRGQKSHRSIHFRCTTSTAVRRYYLVSTSHALIPVSPAQRPLATRRRQRLPCPGCWGPSRDRRCGLDLTPLAFQIATLKTTNECRSCWPRSGHRQGLCWVHPVPQRHCC
jgi:hypothetical protein